MNVKESGDLVLDLFVAELRSLPCLYLASTRHMRSFISRRVSRRCMFANVRHFFPMIRSTHVFEFNHSSKHLLA